MSTILQIAGADKNLSTLMKGMKAAIGLEDALNGIGPFTILGPINLAFSKMTTVNLEDLMKQGKTIELTEMLSFHVLTGKKLYRDFTNGQKLKTVNGQEVLVTVKDGEVRINGAMILAHDRQGSNGVVHSIDAVNLPAANLAAV
jgi:uncharacterized surface protein with fasciclin (FAS1) repeats